MPDRNQEHTPRDSVHLLDNAILANADPKQIRTIGKLYTPGRARVFLGDIDGAAQPAVKRGVAQVREKFLSSPAEKN